MVIRNRSGMNLVLDTITVDNGKQPRPLLRVSGTNSSLTTTYAYEIPKLSILSHQGGDVTFAGHNGAIALDQDVSEGIVTIRMNLDTLEEGKEITSGALTTATGTRIWANNLIVTGAHTIGTKDNRFQVNITELAAIDHESFQDQPERDTYVSMTADSDIYGQVRHVLISSTKKDGSEIAVMGPTLSLGDVLSANGNVDLILDAPGKVVTEFVDNTNLDVTKPGTGDNLVNVGTVTENTVIKDQDGKETDYVLTPDGTIIHRNQDTYLNMSDYLLYQADGDRFYLLPNNLMLRVDASGTIQSAEGGPEGVNYDFSDVSFQLNNGALKSITYMDGNRVSKVIDFTSGTVTMNIGTAGGTIYLTRDENQLAWTLPDGTHIYLKNAFINTEAGEGEDPEVSPIHWKDDLYLLEKVETGRTVYHVVKLTPNDDGSYTGYLYNVTFQEIGSTTTITTIQTAEEAEQAAKSALEKWSRGAEDLSISSIATQVAKAIQAVLSKDWQVQVTATSENVGLLKYNVIINAAVSSTSTDTENVPTITALTRTLMNQTLYPSTESSAASDTLSGAKAMSQTKGVEFAENVLGKRSGNIQVSQDGKITSIQNGDFTFQVTYIPALDAYVAVKESSVNPWYNARYNELADKYFRVESNGSEYKVTEFHFEDTAKGTGLISGDKLNGGYKKVEGGYLFVDNVSDNEGIFFALNKAVAFKNGAYYYVNISYAHDENGKVDYDLTKATLMYGPQMQQATDVFGHPMYERLQFQYMDPLDHDKTKYFWSDGMDEEYQKVLQILKDADGFTEEDTDTEDKTYRYLDSLQPVGLVYTDGKLDYDKSQLVYNKDSNRIYTAAGKAQAMENGKYVYVDANGNRFTHAKSYDDLMADSNALSQVVQKYGYQFFAYYNYPIGTVTIAPAGDNGMNVTYMPFSSGTITFDLPEEKGTGYGVIDQYTRVILTDSDDSGLPKGSILYLDEDGNVITIRTPDGMVRFYEQGSYLGAANEIYSETDSSTGQLLLTKGAKFLVHQAATDIYMAPHSIRNYNSAAEPNGMYFHSDYFAKAGSTLVKLNLGEVNTLDDSYLQNTLKLMYPNDTVKNRFNGASIGAVTDASGKVYMYVLEKGDASVILLPDGTWYASDGEAGVLKSTESILLLPTEDPTKVVMEETLQGESITIIFGGENTSLNDNDDIVADSHTNVITNNLKIIATDNGNIFEEKDPIVLKPFSGDTCNIQIIGSIATSGSYGGEAYAKTLLEANVNLHDTSVSEDGSIDLEIYKGNTGLENVIVEDGGELTVDVENGGNVSMENVSVLGNGQGSEGKLTVSTKEGNVSIGRDNGQDSQDIIISGVVDVTTGKGSISLTDAEVSGTAEISSKGDGSITMQTVDITSSGDLTMTNKGVGAVDMDNVNIGGEATVSTDNGDVDMDVISVAQGGKLDLDTGSGSVTMGENGTASDNAIVIDGTAEITSGTGKIHMNQVKVNQTGKLAVDTGKAGGNDNDVIVDAVYVDGLMTITTTGDPAQGSEPGSDLLMKDGSSKLVLDENFKETRESEDGEEMFFDIGGNIGTPECYFKVSFEGEDEKPSLTLNIRNANDIYLTQLTDIPTEIENGEDTGRLEGDTVKTEHDECISDLGDKEVQVRIPDQTPEELAKQLAGNLAEETLLQLMDGKLSGTAVRDILALSEESIAESLTGMTSLQMEQLWNTVIGENSAPALEEKLTDVAAMREKLNAEGTDTSKLSDEQVQLEYDSYYQQKRSDYHSQLSNAVLGKLSEDDSLTGTKISALLNLSGVDAPMEAVLAGVIGGEKIKVDQNGDPIQTVDDSGTPLYLDAQGNLTTEAEDADGNPNAPVYETEPLLDDETELFKAYWESLTDAQKRALVESAYEALVGNYPPVKDQTDKPRDLVLVIGTSTGESYLLNVGDITIQQSGGTFTAGEVVSTHGDVTITAPSIEGIAAEDKAVITDSYVQQMYEDKYVGEKTEDGTTTYGTDSNVYAENHSYTATVDGIGAATELTTEQRSWKEDVIANIVGEDLLPGADDYDPANVGSWDILRNKNGEIEMNFVASFNGIRDIDLLTETTLNASAVGDIAITELTGNQMVNNVTSTAGSVTLKAPDGEMKIQHITAGGSANLEAEGSILDNREDGDTKVNVNAGSGSITSATGSIGADPDHRIDVSIGSHLTTDSFGDTNLNAVGSLNLTADTADGILHVDGTGDLTIENTEGSLNLGAIEAAGDVSITAQGGLVLGDKLGRDAQVKGDSISVTAGNGDVGTAEAPLLVDTNTDETGNPGVLNAKANNGDVFITEITGDMTIGSITSTGAENSVNLKTEDGSIVESDKGSSDLIKDAVDAAIAAAEAQAKADALEDQKQVLDNYVNTLDSVKQELQDALVNRNAAKSDLDQAQAEEAAAKQLLEDAKAELENLKNAENPDADAISAQQDKVDSAQSDYDNAKAETQNKQDALNDAEKQLCDVVNSADGKTLGTVPGLKEAASAEEALDALEQEQQLRENDLKDLTDTLNQALQDAADKQLEAAKKEQNAFSTGITADGNVNLEANSSSGSAGIGEKDNALGITAGGITHIGTGEGTVLKNVDIESGGDLTIDSIVAEDEVNITAMGDIKGSEDQDTVDITAPSGSLSSLRGDIGTQEDPLKTALDKVSAFGENVYLENTKDLIIDSIIASGGSDNNGGNVHLTVDGDVIDGDAPVKPDDTDIIGGDIQIDASGDIGTKENPLDVESDEFGATGGDIHISSEGDVKVDKIVGTDVSISSGGKVTDKDDKDSIIADNLGIDAGVVGEENNPLNVNVSGKLNIHAKFGYINLVNSYRAPDSDRTPDSGWRTRIHEPTGIRVSGYISRNAELFVTDGCEHENCIICKYLEKLPAAIVLSRYHITMTGFYYGVLYVQIPVDETLEGKIVTIAYCDDGKLMTIQVAVKDGFASFFVDRLHTFVILDGQYHAVTESGHQMLASDETGEIVSVDGLFSD